MGLSDTHLYTDLLRWREGGREGGRAGARPDCSIEAMASGHVQPLCNLHQSTSICTHLPPRARLPRQSRRGPIWPSRPPSPSIPQLTLRGEAAKDMEMAQDILQAGVGRGGGTDKFDNAWHLIKMAAGSKAVCFSVGHSPAFIAQMNT